MISALYFQVVTVIAQIVTNMTYNNPCVLYQRIKGNDIAIIFSEYRSQV